jgi:hypothetical protein
MPPDGYPFDFLGDDHERAWAPALELGPDGLGALQILCAEHLKRALAAEGFRLAISVVDEPAPADSRIVTAVVTPGELTVRIYREHVAVSGRDFDYHREYLDSATPEDLVAAIVTTTLRHARRLDGRPLREGEMRPLVLERMWVILVYSIILLFAFVLATLALYDFRPPALFSLGFIALEVGLIILGVRGMLPGTAPHARRRSPGRPG